MNIKYIYTAFVISLILPQLLGLSSENVDFSNTNRFVKWIRSKHNSTSNASHCGECSCGIPGDQKRVVGGISASETKYPWMAMLFYNGNFYCGGTLINNYYILTAAHCSKGFLKNLITIRLSSYLISDSSNSIERNVQDIRIHPQFNQISYNNDIALIKMSSSIKFSNELYPVCLTSGSKSYIGEMGVITGWGTTKEDGKVSNNLREVSVPIISNTDCRLKVGETITRNMICAGENAGNKDACQGDSGGPMHVIENNRFYEVGIVSWGKGCARPNLPGVYTRVSVYNSWIKSNTADACYCSS